MIHPMGRFIRDGDVVQYDELVTWNLHPELSVEYELFYVELTDIASYCRALETIETIEWYRTVRLDDRSLFVLVCQQIRERMLALRKTFARLQVVVVPPIVYDTEAVMEFTVIGEQNALQTLVESVPGVTVLDTGTLETYDRPAIDSTAAVTDRQLEMLETAVRMGYYAVPREASLEDVATALECAKSTVSVTLRKAEATIIRSALT